MSGKPWCCAGEAVVVADGLAAAVVVVFLERGLRVLTAVSLLK